MQQILNVRLCDAEMMVETADPSHQNPEHDEDQEGGADAVHYRLEVALVLCSLD